MEHLENEAANQTQPDIYQQEELCQKSIKAVSKALFMRLVVAGILIGSVVAFPMELWVWGLMLLVVVIDLAGAAPLIAELKKQRRRLKALIAVEED